MKTEPHRHLRRHTAAFRGNGDADLVLALAVILRPVVPGRPLALALLHLDIELVVLGRAAATARTTASRREGDAVVVEAHHARAIDDEALQLAGKTDLDLLLDLEGEYFGDGISRAVVLRRLGGELHLIGARRRGRARVEVGPNYLY